MARLFVVNCTGQNRIVNYRLDFTVDDTGRRIDSRLVPYKSIAVPARQQMQFGGELHALQISELVSQLEATCGAVHVDQIRTAKAKGVVKMLWSQDKPVPLGVLRDVVDHNMNMLSEQGAKRRHALALAADNTLAGLVEQHMEKPLAKLEMEFEQVEDPDEDFSGAKLEDGVRVARKPAAKRSRKS